MTRFLFNSGGVTAIVKRSDGSWLVFWQGRNMGHRQTRTEAISFLARLDLLEDRYEKGQRWNA